MKDLREKLHNYKILFIDDEPEIRKTMGIFFDKIFDSVILCADGEEALEIYEKNNDVDIVFTDILMPKLNGIKLATKIREINKNVKIVFITASRGNQELPEGFECEYLTKPVSFDTLINLLKNIDIK